MSVVLVQIINNVACLCRAAASKPFGKIADKYSYITIIEIGLFIAFLGFGFNIFTTPSTWWLIIIFTILYNVSAAGTNASYINILYLYVPREYFVQAATIRNSVCGVFGFFASLVAGKILSVVQEGNNIICGLHIYPRQLLSLISTIFILMTLYIHILLSEKTDKFLN